MGYWKDNPEDWYSVFVGDDCWDDLHGRLGTARYRIEEANDKWSSIMDYSEKNDEATANPSVTLYGFIYVQRRLDMAVSLINDALPYPYQDNYEMTPIMGHKPSFK